MKVFIAGATGVIGRRVVPVLVTQGHSVTGIGRTAERRARLEQLGATAVKLDLFDAAALRRAVHGHDVVINLATHIPKTTRMFFPRAWRENDQVRKLGSANLIDAAIAGDVERFVQESFALTYPDMGDRWIFEDTPIRPTRYNRTVADAEWSAARFTEHGGIGVVLRFAAFYGPDSGQTRELIRYARRGWAALPGPPDAYFSSVSHDDAAAAVVAALGLPAGAYNMVDDEPLRRREFFDALAAALGTRPPRLPPAWTVRLMGSLGETLGRSVRMSNRKLRAEGGWSPRFPSVREGWQAVLQAAPAEPTVTLRRQ
ncbi:MAG: NAD(P)-dependent oxidoreductase [Chloroflexota bacterium]|nr:NAD(P)-dependent oxidoreductase [Chloroflexota bacterium]